MLPKIRRNVEIRKETVDAFSFFNASPDAPYGSFRHTKNISSEAFPNVTVRKPHGKKGIEDKIMGALFADGHLLTVRAISKDECAFYVDGKYLGGGLTYGEKSMARLANIVLIVPDNAYYDIEKDEYITQSKKVYPNELISMNNNQIMCKFTKVYNEKLKKDVLELQSPQSGYFNNFFEGDAVEISDCRIVPAYNRKLKVGTRTELTENADGYPSRMMLITDYIAPETGESEYFETVFTLKRIATEAYTVNYKGSESGALDSSQNALFLYQNAKPTGTGGETPPKPDDLFDIYSMYNVGDPITVVQGSVDLTKNEYLEGYVMTPILRQKAYDYDAEKKRYRVYLIFDDNAFGTFTGRGAIPMCRLGSNMPTLDFVFENENRMWGAQGNTIYASKLGNPLNFQSFAGISTDSYAVEMSGEGKINAGISYSGYPMFFKDDRIFKVYGTKPENFQVSTICAPGVSHDNRKSLAVCSGVLYYCCDKGIVAYTGAYPKPVSDELNDTKLTKAVAGDKDGEYRVCLKRQNEERRELFTYDCKNRVWTREDYADTQHFVSTDSGLIRIENTYADDEEKSLLFLDGQGNTEFVQESEDGIEFEAILPARLGNIPLRKRLLYVYLNVQIERNSNLGVAVRHEGDTEFREVANISAKEKRSVLIPIKPKASSDFEISLYGKGKIALYSITREYQM